MNGDGRADVVSFESNGGMYVWLATAQGSFDGPYWWGSNGTDIGGERYRLGDVNGDGRIGLEEVIYIMQVVAEYRQ